MLFGSAFSSEALPDPSQPPAESYRSAQGRVVIGAPPLPPPNVPGNRVMVFGAPAPVPAPRAPQPEFVPRPPTEAERILDRVAGDLEDEQALLVASDALMELGDARGRLIAFMLEEERQTDLMRKVKVNVLIRDHAEQWAPPGARFISFRRGLPIDVEWNGPCDPAHHAWRSARNINATLERVPRPSVFDVERPRLTRFTCTNRALFEHVLAAGAKNLEVLDGHIERDQLLEGLATTLSRFSKLRLVTLRSTTQQFDAGLAPIHLRAFLAAASRLPSLKLVRLSMSRLPPAELAACLAVAPGLTVQFVMPWNGVNEKPCTLGIDTQRMQILLPEGVPTDVLIFELREELAALLGGPLSIVRSG